MLADVMVLAICGAIGNCDDWPDIALFARQRVAWFKRFLKLPHGVPSHDTFERVFAALDPRAFECCCLAWLRDVAQLVGVGHIAIDGKTLRGSAGSPLGAFLANGQIPGNRIPVAIPKARHVGITTK